ncbi:hypothetical protein AN478_10740 [Thiohalorhabdus denitrificans]|uniref:Uncharacterized conserved protein YeaO, DUF488 family n=1 Tax=Thiohalorhabdus denitrificans TaxID=381306 RepID=A0A0P9CSD3_9GAMM|nr:DUF488 domain-containing protein [Thiohalorhabdus denitrificans]KPV39600.1 hypothetical protein AN478_10740 [Thiohalorhabdus denitrificans]SCX97157.1 Uncharacterized conserved protein YeaO, DUF488 family [Thiohalorhabdus denitrificans]
MGEVRLKRVYDDAEPADGERILVERMWPRGMRKEDARLDLWLKEVAPSPELRNWFGHDPEKWPEFKRRYRDELSQRPDLLEDLRQRARSGPVTLLYAARDREHNSAVALRETLEEANSR